MALLSLCIQVHIESVAVREGLTTGAEQLSEGRRLQALAREEASVATVARRSAESLVLQSFEGRKEFELERLAIAKERRALGAEKVHSPRLLVCVLIFTKLVA